MKFDFRDIIKKIRPIDYKELFFKMLDRGNRWIIFVSLIGMAVFCINLWNKYIYHPNWSEEQKREYLNSQERGVTFDSNKFNSVILFQEERKERFEKGSEKSEDIFRLGERKTE